jgi:ABC-type uncharacterized transport system substrate-binding protein
MKKRHIFMKTASIPSWFIVCCGILVFLMSALPEAQAHPHVFIDQRLNAVFDDKGLAGIKVHWKFDEMFTSMIAEDYDVNRNGRLEAGEIAAIREKAFSYISGNSYFCFIKIENKPFQVKFIKDFKATLENNELVYEFFIPCHVAAAGNFKKLSVATYDPSYYTAIFFAENSPVSLTSAGAYVVKTAVREDPGIRFYYDQVNPWSLYLEFRKKP